MDLTQLYNDPATQMLAGRTGLSVQDYVSQMDPRAVQANMANINRGPAQSSLATAYVNQYEYDNMLATGANSPLAFIPEMKSNPMTDGMLFNPTMGQPSQADVPPQVPTVNSGGPTQREAPMLAQPPVMGQPPAPQAAPILSSSGQGATQGALSNSGAGAAVVSRPNSGPSSGSRQTPTNNTANARNSGMPDMRIGRSEGLGRIGTAMLAGNKTGLLDAMAAGGNAMYANNDANRQAELAEYQNSERIRLEKVKEAQVAAALAARGGSGKGKSGGGTSPYGSVGAQAAQFNEIIAALRSDSGLTGPVAGTVGQARDRSGVFGGDATRADLRLQMEGIALNEQLLYTAKTKGAITDREMAMFRKPIPKITDSEELWIAWLTPRADVLNQLAQNGISNAASASSGGSTAAPTSSANPDALSAADAILGIGG